MLPKCSLSAGLTLTTLALNVSVTVVPETSYWALTSPMSSHEASAPQETVGLMPRQNPPPKPTPPSKDSPVVPSSVEDLVNPKLNSNVPLAPAPPPALLCALACEAMHPTQSAVRINARWI